MFQEQKSKQGSALLLTTILLFVVLSMVVSLTYVTVMEQKMSQKTKSSTGAFFNADSGIEYALNKIANGSGNISNVFSGYNGGEFPCPAGFDCNIFFLDKDGKVITADGPIDTVKAIRAVGKNNNDTSRAIEAAVAAGVNGCYVSYKDGCSGDSCCLAGFTNQGSLGHWGACRQNIGSFDSTTFRPPNAGCGSWVNVGDFEEAFLCCK